MTKNNGMTKSVLLALDPDLYSRIKEKSEEMKIPVTKTIRTLLNNALAIMNTEECSKVILQSLEKMEINIKQFLSNDLLKQQSVQPRSEQDIIEQDLSWHEVPDEKEKVKIDIDKKEKEVYDTLGADEI